MLEAVHCWEQPLPQGCNQILILTGSLLSKKVQSWERRIAGIAAHCLSTTRVLFGGGVLYKSCFPIKVMMTASLVLHVDPGSESERRGRGPWGIALREETLLAKEGSI